MQSKTLMDIIQMECLAQNSCVLKITSATGEGRIWITKGEIVDAAVEDKIGKPAIVEMIGWKAGNFEVLPAGLPRPRTIFVQYESLLMETAQSLDEAEEANLAEKQTPESLLSAFSRFTGVQFAMAVELGETKKYEHWGCDDPAPLAVWIHQTAHAFKQLGTELKAGELHDIQAFGSQRNLAILSADDEVLGVGFTRALAMQQVRETLSQIEARWAS